VRAATLRRSPKHPCPNVPQFTQRATARQTGLRMFRKLMALIALWRCRARSRRQLAGMNSRGLQDIGVTPWDAFREANKPFWRE
jgi:uncharacterized protein YjiS (DUF1127 family)